MDSGIRYLTFAMRLSMLRVLSRRRRAAVIDTLHSTQDVEPLGVSTPQIALLCTLIVRW